MHFSSVTPEWVVQGWCVASEHRLFCWVELAFTWLKWQPGSSHQVYVPANREEEGVKDSLGPLSLHVSLAKSAQGLLARRQPRDQPHREGGWEM